MNTAESQALHDECLWKYVAEARSKARFDDRDATAYDAVGEGGDYW